MKSKVYVVAARVYCGANPCGGYDKLVGIFSNEPAALYFANNFGLDGQGKAVADVELVDVWKS